MWLNGMYLFAYVYSNMIIMWFFFFFFRIQIFRYNSPLEGKMSASTVTPINRGGKHSTLQTSIKQIKKSMRLHLSFSTSIVALHYQHVAAGFWTIVFWKSSSWCYRGMNCALGDNYVTLLDSRKEKSNNYFYNYWMLFTLH